MRDQDERDEKTRMNKEKWGGGLDRVLVDVSWLNTHERVHTAFHPANPPLSLSTPSVLSHPFQTLFLFFPDTSSATSTGL